MTFLFLHKECDVESKRRVLPILYLLLVIHWDPQILIWRLL